MPSAVRFPRLPLRTASRYGCAAMALVTLSGPACKSETAAEPEPTKAATDTTAITSGKSAVAEQAEAKRKARAEAIRKARAHASKSKEAAKPVASVQPTPGDPLQGNFTVEDALRGLPGDGDQVIAEIDTDAGKLTCELWPDKAPITVANFVGLARGTRPWNKQGKWVKEPLYDGTVFHRVIKGFMIQGGDPAGNGSGGPGFVIPDEIWAGARHDTRGQICMANRGPNTNGSQFFIMDGKAPHLDGGYTIFGQCAPDEVIEKLAATPVRGDRAIAPPKIKKVTVRRK